MTFWPLDSKNYFLCYRDSMEEKPFSELRGKREILEFFRRTGRQSGKLGSERLTPEERRERAVKAVMARKKNPVKSK